MVSTSRCEVLQGVGRRTGEITFLVAEFVAEVGHFLPPGVPGALDGVEEVVAGVLSLIEPDVVEDKELDLGAEVGGFREAGGIM